MNYNNKNKVECALVNKVEGYAVPTISTLFLLHNIITAASGFQSALDIMTQSALI